MTKIERSKNPFILFYHLLIKPIISLEKDDLNFPDFSRFCKEKSAIAEPLGESRAARALILNS